MGDWQGPTVFYFHGLPGSRMEAMLIAAEAHETGVNLISFDRPGMGRSTFQRCRKIVDWSRDMMLARECLGLGNECIGVLAMSGGAPYGAVCARYMPERLSRVAIVSGHTQIANMHLCPGGNQEGLLRFSTRRPWLARSAFGILARRLDQRPDRVLRRLTQGWTDLDRQLVLGTPELHQLLADEIGEATRCGTSGVATEARLLTQCWGFDLREYPRCAGFDLARCLRRNDTTLDGAIFPSANSRQ